MKTLFITFIFIASSTSVLPQTQRIGQFKYVETKPGSIARGVFEITPSMDSHRHFAHFGFTLRQQLERKQTLSKAVQEKDLAAVKALLAIGADPNIGDQSGTPLA